LELHDPGQTHRVPGPAHCNHGKSFHSARRRRAHARRRDRAARQTPESLMNGADPSAIVLESLRLLKWNELVRRGDFVKDGRGGFEPWVGPSGFRADAFLKQVYRALERPRAEA